MSEKELKELFSLGENSIIEFKREDVHNDSLGKVIVAFANFEGGDIWIGVEDDGSISGVNIPKLDEKIVHICRNNISPPIIPNIQTYKIENKQIIRVGIDKGKSKPYKTRGKYYIRAGSVAVEPTSEELIRLFQESGLLHFEAKTAYGTSIEDIDLLKFKIYCEKYRKADIEDEELSQLLYNFEMMDEEGQCTIAGLLLFGKNIRRHLPQAGVQLAHFSGKDKTGDILDSKEVITFIDENIRLAEQFVKFNSTTRSYFPKGTIRRKDVEDYPGFAVRELIANAFAHRDWTIFGQQIRVFLYENRLEIFSPGKLPNTLILQRALNGVSYFRNPIIAQLLKDYEITEKFGRGLNKIIRYYKRNNLKAPEFEATPHYFNVTLFKSNPISIEE